MTCQACFLKEDEIEAKEVLGKLEFLGYKANTIQKKILNEEGLILFFFSSKSKKEKVFQAFPWLKEQEDNSSIKHLKILPVFLYHSSKEDPEEILSDKLADFYESIFSLEFKPYGWDFDSSCPEREFNRVFNQYLE